MNIEIEYMDVYWEPQYGSYKHAYVQAPGGGPGDRFTVELRPDGT